jgi:hypothetical protein
MLDTNSDPNLALEANPGNFDQNLNLDEYFPSTVDVNSSLMIPTDYDTLGQDLIQTSQLDLTTDDLARDSSISKASNEDTLTGYNDNQPLAGEADSLDGLWKSDGHGYIAEIEGNEVQIYEVTENSSIPSLTATNVDKTPGDGKVDFAAEDGSVFQIRSTDSEDVKIFNLDGENGGVTKDITIQRLDEKPAFLDRPVSNDPLTNFDVFWDSFAENYNAFSLKDVDWSAVREEARSQITSETTSEELFEILKSAVEPFEDAHISIDAGDIGQFSGERAGFNDKKLEQKGEEIKGITDKYLSTPLQSFANDQISYGTLEPGVGYLRIDSFGEYTDSDKFADNLAELNTALDTIFTQPEQPESLVIDIRGNGGGRDELGIEIADRLTDKPYLAYSQITRNDPDDPSGFTDPNPIMVKPNDKPGFSGNVTLLTSRYTTSAAESFTLALMGREQNVVRIGEDTQGVFGGVLGRTLPNGWTFGFGNKLELTESGETLETEGVPPDIEVPVFTDEDLANGRDSAIEKTEEILMAKS